MTLAMALCIRRYYTLSDNGYYRYFPNYGFIARGHGAAVLDGSLIDGEAALLS